LTVRSYRMTWMLSATAAVKCQMKFNVEKCKVVHYGKRGIEFEYSLYGHPLEAVSSEKKDLGVVFSNDLKVRRQCEEAYSKYQPDAGLINRTIHSRILKFCFHCIRLYCETALGILFSSMESTVC